MRGGRGSGPGGGMRGGPPGMRGRGGPPGRGGRGGHFPPGYLDTKLSFIELLCCNMLLRFVVTSGVHQNQECPVVQEVVDHHHQEWEVYRVAVAEEVEAVVSEVEEEVILVGVTILEVVAVSVDEEWIEAAEEDLGKTYNFC